MPAPLKKNQKWTLVDLANKAFLKQSEGRPAGGPLDGESADSYRHRHVAIAVGKAGLRACTQADYQILKAYFLRLLGRYSPALKAIRDDQSNPLRVAQYKLVEACRHAGVHLSYAEKICRAKFKCSLEELKEPRLIWIIKYDIDRAARRRSGPYVSAPL